MARSSKSSGNGQMTITVQGYEVTLYFSDKANTQVGAQIRQALLGMYLLKKQ